MGPRESRSRWLQYRARLSAARSTEIDLKFGTSTMFTLAIAGFGYVLVGLAAFPVPHEYESPARVGPANRLVVLPPPARRQRDWSR